MEKNHFLALIFKVEKNGTNKTLRWSHTYFKIHYSRLCPIHIIPPSMPFPIFCSGSFAVQYGDHLRSGIICGSIWGSFAVPDHLRSRIICGPGIICGAVQMRTKVLLSTKVIIEDIELEYARQLQCYSVYAKPYH